MFTKQDLLCLAIRKGQIERSLLVNGRRDRADIRIIAEDTQKMRLPIFPDIALDPQADSGRGFLRDAYLLKQPEPQVCVLHRFHPPSSPAFL